MSPPRRVRPRARVCDANDRADRRPGAPLHPLPRRRPRAARRGSPRKSCRSPRNADDAVKRVKRRLHQAVGAFRGAAAADSLATVRGHLGRRSRRRRRSAPPAPMRSRATRRPRERLPHIDGFFARIWELTGGSRATLLDLGCGLGPLALPWMGLSPEAHLSRLPMSTGARSRRSDAFLDLVGQPHAVHARDLVADGPPADAADVALLLKLVPTLDRQDPIRGRAAAGRSRRPTRGHLFRTSSLGGRRRGMEADLSAPARSSSSPRLAIGEVARGIGPERARLRADASWLIRSSPAAARSPFRPSCPMRRGPACAARAARTCAAVGIEGVVVNAFHLLRRPGARVVQAAGGIHRFMDWDRPIAQRLGRVPGLEPHPPGSRAAASSATTRSSSASRRPARSGT